VGWQLRQVNLTFSKSCLLRKKKLAIVTVWLSLLSLISRFMNDCRIFYYS